MLSVLAAAGLAAFLLGGGASIRLNAAQAGALLLLLIPLRLCSIVFHEAGHALATRAFGRVVRGAGVGWYVFGPIAFVDTSDMWLAPRWPRVLVSLADLLDRPNLRLHALRWLGREGLGVLRDPARLRGHYGDLLYGLASLLYVGIMAAALVLLYRLTVQQWFAGLLPESVAASLAWVLAAAAVLGVGGNVWNALRGGRRQG